MKIMKKEMKKMKKLNKPSIEKVRKVLHHCATSGTDRISFEKIRKICNYKIFYSQSVNDWLRGFPQLNVVVETYRSDNDKCIRFINLKATILDFQDEFKIKIEGDKKSAVGKLISNTKSEPLKKIAMREQVDAFSEESDVVRGMATLIYVAKKAIGVFELLSLLRRKEDRRGLGLVIGDKDSLLTIVSRYPKIFTYHKSQDTIALADRNTSIELVRDQLNPYESKVITYARIGLSEEELKLNVTDIRYIQCEKISEISPTDGIYKITYTKGLRSLRALTKLYRTFRGSDKLLDEELERSLQTNIAKADIRSWNDHLPTEIEDALFKNEEFFE